MVPKIFHPDEGDGSLTVREVVGMFLEHADRGGSTEANANRRHILETFCAAHGDLAVDEAKAYHLRLWVDSQEQLKSDWTRQRWVVIVKSAFNWALTMGITERHPFQAVKQKGGERGRPLTDAEFTAMLREATDGRLKRFVLFLRLTGCRPGEASKARWDDLDLERGVIVLKKHKTAKKTGVPRTIYLSGVALRMLRWIRENEPATPTIFVNAWGLPWTRATLSLRLKGIRERAGLPRDAKYYGLRHKFATDAVLRRVELATLAELLGHKGTRTTSHYIHLAGQTDHLRAAVEQATGKRPT